MNDIRLNVTMHFRPDDLAEVRTQIETFIRDAASDHGMLGYAFFVGEDGRSIAVREHYADEKAMVDHLQNMNPTALGRLTELVELSDVECCGPRTSVVSDALAAFGKVHFFAPLARL